MPSVTKNEVTPDAIEAFGRVERENLDKRVKLLVGVLKDNPHLRPIDLDNIAPRASNSGIYCCNGAEPLTERGRPQM